MKSFAYLMHPLNMHQVKMFWPLARILPVSFVKPFLKKQSLKIHPLKTIRSLQNKEIEGELIISPMHPEELLKMDDESVLEMIISAGNLSHDLGFKILGLSGYFGVVADRKSMLYKHMKIPITCGTAFSAWTIYEAAFKACHKNKREMKQLTLTVMCPANGVGTLCARKFAESAGRVVLTGNPIHQLEKVQKTILSSASADVAVDTDVARAAAQADILVNADSLNSLEFDPAWFKTGAIVCDISVFQNFAGKAAGRKDVTAIDCKVVNLPQNSSLGIDLDLPQHTVCPVLAETMLLAFEENYANFSLGESVNPDKLDYIANVASRHGFAVSVPGAEIT